MSGLTFQSGWYTMPRSNFQSGSTQNPDQIFRVAVHNVQIKFSEWPVHNVLAGPVVHCRLVCDSGATFHGTIFPHGIIGSSFFVLIIIITRSQSLVCSFRFIHQLLLLWCRTYDRIFFHGIAVEEQLEVKEVQPSQPSSTSLFMISSGLT